MNLDRLRDHWDHLGETDPMWAVLTDHQKRDRKWQREEFFAHGEREITQVFRYLTENGIAPRRDRVLDFGCGVGRISQALCSRFDHVVGIDIAPSMIRAAEANNRNGPRCRYVVNCEPGLSMFPDAQFDFVYSSIVLQHMEPRYSLAYIREFVRVVAPGGYILFQIPSAPAWNTAGFLLRILPPSLARRLRKMDMYGLKPGLVESTIREAGGEVLHRTPDQSAGPNWGSFRYLARK